MKDFYEQVGWQKGEEEIFVDTLKHYDLRPVSKDYLNKCHLRVHRYIKSSGKYFLDVASGPITHPEHLSYSNGFDIRICVDLSFLALKEARKKLEHKGIYLLADITNLPLKDDLVDAIVSLHTIYHVPADEQSRAFHEVYRVLKPGSSAVVVYSWGPLVFLPKMMITAAKKIRGRRSTGLIYTVMNVLYPQKLTYISIPITTDGFSANNGALISIFCPGEV